MRPKSGLPKRKALRNMPRFEFGFRRNPATKPYRNPFVGSSDRSLPVPPFDVVSLFCGCGGLDLGLLGGFRYLGDQFDPLPFRVVKGYDNDPRALETYKLNLGDEVELRDLEATDLAKPRMPKC